MGVSLLPPFVNGAVGDAELLERFLKERDEAAFELLMERHGPMVFGVCRRVLRHTQDAEDAFQATFLMLARKATAIGQRAAVSGWLYTVAYRIALRARMRGARRGQFEKPLDELPVDVKSGDPADLSAWRELRRLLDSELSRIPEKYRTAFVLCHLEGKTCEEAAEHLGCPRGTVQSRVGRARQRLQARLGRRGWMPASTPLTGLLEQHAATLANLSPAVIYATAHGALLASLGQSLARIASSSVLELADDAARSLRRSRVGYAVLLLALLLLAAAATGWGLRSPHRPKESAPLPAPTAASPSGCHGPAAPPAP